MSFSNRGDVLASIEEKLEDARKDLLDLTFRNRLINYRPARKRSVRVVDEEPREIFDLLVIQGRRMRFSPRRSGPGEEGSEPTSDQDPDDELLSNNADIVWTLPSEDVQIPGNHIDLALQTNLEPESLQKRLFYITQESQSVFEEQGYTILYLAAGFLEWTETPGGEGHKAPLILIPVEIEREQVRTSFKLVWTGEDLITNVSLQAKLREIDVDLPPLEMPAEKEGIDLYLAAVKDSIQGRESWLVTREIQLDFFTFSKFVMYRDLDPAIWPGESTPASHPLIAAIFRDDPSVGPSVSEAPFPEQEVDSRLPVASVYHVLDADSSQIAAIQDLKAGINLVVEGPPGTGKSQTIANMIAEFLALGKTVLFVSEKMAALDVVKSRLDSLGLGIFCLDLHNSKKANRKRVLGEIQRALDYQCPSPQDTDQVLQDVEELRSQLNGYSAALRDPVGDLGQTPYHLYGMWESARRLFLANGRQIPIVALPSPDSVNPAGWSLAQQALKELDALLPLVSPIEENPWRFCSPGSFFPNDVEEIGRLLSSALDSLALIQAVTAQLVEYSGIANPTTRSNLVNAVLVTELLVASEPIERSVLLNEAWNGPNAEIEGLIRKVEAYQGLRTSITSRMQTSVLEVDLEPLRHELEAASKKFLHSFFGPYKSVRAQIDAHYLSQGQRSDESILSDLHEVRQCRTLKLEIQEASSTGRSIFGLRWHGEESEPESLRAFSRWMVSFRHELLTGILTSRAVEIVSQGVAADRVRALASSIEEVRLGFNSSVSALLDRLHADPARYFPDGLDVTEFDDLQFVFEAWKRGIDRLVPWAQYLTARKEVEGTLAAPLLPLIDRGQIQNGELRACLEANYAGSMLRAAFARNPVLERFVGRVHEQRIEEFGDRDRQMIRENRHRIARRLCRNRPTLAAGASRSSELGVLQTEFNRKRGHMPIRQLLIRAGTPIQQIKPCFMMSPPSIALFLDPRSIQFDIVVFDEASQVKPAEALGALLRGRQVAVIGDSKQLPPTTFFDRIIAASEIEDGTDAMPSDMESILNLCRTRFPYRTLRWHYRSRHDSLIALSNQEFYDNQLFVYPSPMREDEELGLKFIHLPETVYDRGRSATNRGEARGVAEAVIDHARRHPKRSLGIGTFNVHQQEAILEELERLREEKPDLEHFFATKGTESFFVKNLETIQGDERDVIFLSVGYGFDAQHRLSMNFGALTRDGGERRLNVLMTRARQRCVVFSNFRARDMPMSDMGAASRGVQVLKLFLEYAETGRVPCSAAPLEESESPFEDSVYSFLTENGHEVHKRVGSAGFRLDLAVVNPERPGEYLIGVECDGATYHSSCVARDRDRLRRQVLEGLGWQITRVWSTDWFRNPGASQEALRAAIDRVREAAREGIVLPEPVAEPVPAVESAEIVKKDEEVPMTVTTAGPPVVELAPTPAYVPCRSLVVSAEIEPGEYPPIKMAALVAEVVEVEGPVHRKEAANRIRDAFGLKRTGRQVQAAIDAGIEKAVEHWGIQERGEFLWPREHPIPVVRRRGEGIRPQIEMICDEEIEEAVRFVLERQYATEKDALAIEACRVLGFGRINGRTKTRVRLVVADMISRGVIQEKANGLIDLTMVAPDSGRPSSVG